MLGELREPRDLRWVPVLAGFWLVLSGHYTVLLVSLGALSVAVVVFVELRAGLDAPVTPPVRVWPKIPGFAIWLAAEIIRSSVSVCRDAWSPTRDVRPVVGITPASDLSELTRVIYAHSITVTPGTLAMRWEEGDIRVHSLQERDLESLRSGRMLERVRRLEPR